MLTDAAIKSLKPKDKLYKVSDRDGMYVVVNPSGAVVFRYDYRMHGRRDRLRVGRRCQCRDEERRRWRGPGGDDRFAKPPAQEQSGQPDANRNRPDPGGRQFRAKPRNFRCLKDQNEGATIVDDDGDQPRHDWVGQIVETDGR